MLVILSAGIAPGLALLSYFYLKDQYEHEPILFVFKTFMYGAILTFPIMFIQHVFISKNVLRGTFGNAFIGTSLLEEFFKWFILYFAVYMHRDFNEPYDGIVYGVSVSLGFATIENILSLVGNGIGEAIGRAFLPVSSHALFGVVMGYYLAKGKFSVDKKHTIWIFLSFFVPFLFHGVYDFILVSLKNWIYCMIPFMLFLWWYGLRKVKNARILSAKYHEKALEE